MCFLEVEDVDAAADAEEVRLHLWVPLFFAVAEVTCGGEELFRRGDRHGGRGKEVGSESAGLLTRRKVM